MKSIWTDEEIEELKEELIQELEDELEEFEDIPEKAVSFWKATKTIWCVYIPTPYGLS